MAGVFSIIIAVVGIVTGYVLVKRKCRKKEDNQNKCADNTTESSPLDKMYDELLDFDDEDIPSNDNTNGKKAEPIVMKLRDRSFWTIYRGTILSAFVIVLFAVAIASVSSMSHRAYSDRKKVDDKTRDEAQVIEMQAEQDRIEKEGERIMYLSRQLDSIDYHIKQLKPATKKNNKKKTGK